MANNTNTKRKTMVDPARLEYVERLMTLQYVNSQITRRAAKKFSVTERTINNDISRIMHKNRAKDEIQRDEMRYKLALAFAEGFRQAFAARKFAAAHNYLVSLAKLFGLFAPLVDMPPQEMDATVKDIMHRALNMSPADRAARLAELEEDLALVGARPAKTH